MTASGENGFRWQFGRWLGCVYVRYKWVKEGRIPQRYPVRILDAALGTSRIKRLLDEESQK